MAKYDVRADLEINDRVTMRKGSPVKDGTVKAYDEEEAFVIWDDGQEGWIPLYNIYITRKGHEITFLDGTSWFHYKNRE